MHHQRGMIWIWLLFPWIELALLLFAASALGGLEIFLWTVATFFIGLWLIRQQQAKLLEAMHRGIRLKDPFSQGFTVISGMLLLLPGLITDTLGLLLLLPPIKRWLTRHNRGNEHIVSGSGRIIEVSDPTKPHQNQLNANSKPWND